MLKAPTLCFFVLLLAMASGTSTVRGQAAFPVKAGNLTKIVDTTLASKESAEEFIRDSETMRGRKVLSRDTTQGGGRTVRYLEYLKSEGSGWFPMKDTNKIKDFWGTSDLAALQNVNVSVSTNRFSLYTEFVSDYMVIWDRFVRVSFGGLVSRSDTSRRTDSTISSIDRFFGAGGNALLTLATPIWYYAGPTYFNPANGEHETRWTFRVLLAPKLALDIPAVSGDVTELSGSADIGIEWLYYLRSFANRINFVAQGRFGWINGYDDFYRRLGRQGAFGTGTILLGLNLNNAIQIAASTIWLGPLRRDTPWHLTFQLMPKTGK